MLSEVVNAVFLTFIATEYLIESDKAQASRQQRSLLRSSSRGHWLGLAAVIVINALDRITGAAAFANELLQGFLHLPRISFASAAYVIALYYDCKRLMPCLNITTFLPKVGAAFVRVLPVYPFLAVTISFAFMFLISIFDALHLPEEWLNWPIYYGVLYGPLFSVYYRAKRCIAEEYYSLPTC